MYAWTSLNFQFHFPARIKLICLMNVRRKFTYLGYFPSQFLTTYLEGPVSFEK